MSARTPQASYDSLFQRAGAQYGIPWELLRAQAEVESNLDPNAVSPAGALGLAQFMPATWREVMGPNADPFDPASAIEGQARYLRSLLDRFGGDVDKALAAYNAGPSRVRSVERADGSFDPSRLPLETRNYLSRIQGRMETTRAAAPVPGSEAERWASVSPRAPTTGGPPVNDYTDPTTLLGDYGLGRGMTGAQLGTSLASTGEGSGFSLAQIVRALGGGGAGGTAQKTAAAPGSNQETLLALLQLVELLASRGQVTGPQAMAGGLIGGFGGPASSTVASILGTAGTGLGGLGIGGRPVGGPTSRERRQAGGM